MMEEIRKNKANYSASANVNIKALVNALGHQRAYFAINERGKREYRSEDKIFGADSVIHTNAILLYIYLHFLQPILGAVRIFFPLKQSQAYRRYSNPS